MSLLRSAEQHLVVHIYAAAVELSCMFRLLHQNQVPASEREANCLSFWDEQFNPDSLHS